MFYFVALLSSFGFILSYVFVVPSCLLVRLYSFFSLMNCSAFVICPFRSYSVCVRRSALFGLLLSCFFLLSSPASLLSSVFFLRSSLFEILFICGSVCCLMLYFFVRLSSFVCIVLSLHSSLFCLRCSSFRARMSLFSFLMSFVVLRSSFFVLLCAAVVVRLSSFSVLMMH